MTQSQPLVLLSVSASPLPLALSVSVCLISPDVIVEGERMCASPLSLCKYSSQLSHYLSLSHTLVCACSTYSLVSHSGAWSLFLLLSHLLWVTMLRLGCRCHFTSQGYFIVLDSLLSRFPFCLLLWTQCCFLN